MLVEKIKPDFVLENTKGKLVQLVREGFCQVNVIYSPKGGVRGNHYHKLNTEAFYIVSGKVKLTLQYQEEKENTIFQTGDMFLIHKGYHHIFEYLEDTILISMYDKGVELPENQMDIYPGILKENT